MKGAYFLFPCCNFLFDYQTDRYLCILQLDKYSLIMVHIFSEVAGTSTQEWLLKMLGMVEQRLQNVEGIWDIDSSQEKDQNRPLIYEYSLHFQTMHSSRFGYE